MLIMRNPKNFLRNVLETDLSQDILFTPDKVIEVSSDQSDIVFTTSLVRKRPVGGFLYFDIDEPVQENLYFRLRFYAGKIIRLMISREPLPFLDDSIMLQLDPSLKSFPGRLEEDGNGWLAKDGGSALFRNGKGSFAPQFSPDGLVQMDFQGQDHFVEKLIDAFPAFCLLREDGSVTMGIALRILPGEHFCGTGERFTRPDLFGHQLDLVNSDAAGVNNARAYKNIPFLLSSRGYGIFVHSSGKITFQMEPG